MKLAVLATLFVVIASFAAVSEAVKCYTCNSEIKGCDDPFDKNANIQTTDCASSCLKIKVSAKGQTAVQRGCGLPVDACDAAIKACKASGGSDCKCKQCNSDLCNDSKSVHDIKFKTIGAVLLAAILSMFYY